MKKIKRLEKFVADPKKGFEVHDAIRSGRSVDIDPARLSSVIQEIQEKINEIIDKLSGTV